MAEHYQDCDGCGGYTLIVTDDEDPTIVLHSESTCTCDEDYYGRE